MPTVTLTQELLDRNLAGIDWAKVDAITDSEIEAAVAADPDAPRIATRAELVAGRIRVIRKRTGLTQEAFAARYGIPLGALQDWEAGTAQPDETARAYLRVIANQPEAVAAAYAAE